MARKKPHRRVKKTNQDFYESLPLAITPPVALPEANTKEVLDALTEFGHRLATSLPKFKIPSFIDFDSFRPSQLAKIIKNVPLAAYLATRRLIHTIAITGLRTTDIVLYYAKTARLVTAYG